MSRKVLVGKKSEFRESRKTVVSIEGTELVIWNINGKYLASEARCPHKAYALLRFGHIPDKCDEMLCMGHGYAYNVTTGENIKTKGDEPKTRPLKLHQIVEADGDLYAIIDE